MKYCLCFFLLLLVVFFQSGKLLFCRTCPSFVVYCLQRVVILYVFFLGATKYVKWHGTSEHHVTALPGEPNFVLGLWCPGNLPVLFHVA